MWLQSVWLRVFCVRKLLYRWTYQPRVIVILDDISLRVEQMFLYALNIHNVKQEKLFGNDSVYVTKRDFSKSTN